MKKLSLVFLMSFLLTMVGGCSKKVDNFAEGDSSPTVGTLERDFHNPPHSAKASGYWWWLHSNVDKDAITRDMNEFSAKGIGSVLLVCSGQWGAGRINGLGPIQIPLKFQTLPQVHGRQINQTWILILKTAEEPQKYSDSQARRKYCRTHGCRI